MTNENTSDLIEIAKACGGEINFNNDEGMTVIKLLPHKLQAFVDAVNANSIKTKIFKDADHLKSFLGDSIETNSAPVGTIQNGNVMLDGFLANLQIYPDGTKLFTAPPSQSVNEALEKLGVAIVFNGIDVSHMINKPDWVQEVEKVGQCSIENGLHLEIDDIKGQEAIDTFKSIRALINKREK